MDGLLIGRFQPFHLGHLRALQFALSRVDNLWVGLGSSNKVADSNNPFSADERRQMILSSIDSSMTERISLYPIPDLDNHIKWIELINVIVPRFETIFSNDDLTKHLYSKRGIRIESIPFLRRDLLSGTRIRTLIADGGEWEGLVPDGTRRFLEESGAARIRSSNFK